jgi:hypothetical protein
VFRACAPHTGVRYGEVRASRTAVDDAAFRPNLLVRDSPHVDSIRLVQDNFNTHTPGSCWAVFPPDEAFQRAQRLALPETPTQGSWLHRAELAFAALSHQCLDRRIPALEPGRREVLAWASPRHLERTTVNGKFSQTEARKTLQRHYSPIQKFI